MTPQHFHEVVLLKGAEIQGHEPPAFIPQHAESELVQALRDTEFAESGADRSALLTALGELENRGWMKLHKVAGPWSWQLTPAGVDKATNLSAQLEQQTKNSEKEIRDSVLAQLEKNRRAVAGTANLPDPIDVSAYCAEHQIDPETLIVQCERLIDQGLAQLYPFDQAEVRNGEIVITEAGRQRLDAAPPGAAPTREIADLYRENAHLRRQLETIQHSADALIRDEQLRERVLPLIARDKRYDTAVREACVILEDRVRAKAGASAAVIGLDLIKGAFHEDAGVLIVSEVANEQAGAHQLFRGMVAWIRNSFAHRVNDATAHGDALRIVAFIDYLLDEIGRARAR